MINKLETFLEFKGIVRQEKSKELLSFGVEKVAEYGPEQFLLQYCSPEQGHGAAQDHIWQCQQKLVVKIARSAKDRSMRLEPTASLYYTQRWTIFGLEDTVLHAGVQRYGAKH